MPGHPVHDRVLRFIRDPECDRFDDLARAVFVHQFEAVAPYRRFCVSRGRIPENVGDWRQIPPVPVEAFKHVELACGPVEREFLSTGTTRGADRRSRHRMPDLRLYRDSAVTGMKSFLFPDVERISVVSLIASVEERPDSSLSQMASWAVECFGDPGTRWVVGRDGLDMEAFVDALRSSESSGAPCALLATTAALIHALDALRQRAMTIRLPHGSRVMDTGGDKGAPRPMSRNGLLRAIWNTLAVPGYFCVNEYGMAELSSQLWDNVIRDRVAGRFTPRVKVGPHWVRTLVLDPATLLPQPSGEPGLLCHYDLANAATAMAVLSEDIGTRNETGFTLRGRARGAERRGCSLTVEEWSV